MTEAKFDWSGLEAAAINYMVSAVRLVHDEHPQEHLYAAIFHGFYGDGENIYWPCVAVGSEESLLTVVERYHNNGYSITAEALRWSPADLPHNIEADEESERWAEDCCEFASLNGTFSEWSNVYDRFLHVFPLAAKKAFQRLLQEGIVDKDFITIASDEAGELIPLSLTPEQTTRYFPEYAAAEDERQHLAALPLAQRISALMEKIMGTAEMGHLTRDEYESLLKQSGKEAIPFLTAAIRNKTGDTWIACKLLAEINEPVEEAITALTETLDDCGADDSERGWAASALARLGHTDILAARIEQIPEDIIARGLAAPYTAFRDQGRYLPLDYQPLEQILKQFPHIADAVAKNLTPGCSYCEIKPEEASAAQAGLHSSWAFIRYHAENVLEDLQDNL